MTIRADDEALKQKNKNGKVCFSVGSVHDVTKNFPGLKWSTQGHRLIGHANQKSRHMFSVFVDRDECRESARIVADSAYIKRADIAEREEYINGSI